MKNFLLRLLLYAIFAFAVSDIVLEFNWEFFSVLFLYFGIIFETLLKFKNLK
jgi:hypothetical protein